METTLRVGDVVFVDDKDKAYIDCFIENVYIAVRSLVCGSSEEVGVGRCREVPHVEGMGSRPRCHHSVTVAPLPQAANIIGHAPATWYIALAARLGRSQIYAGRRRKRGWRGAGMGGRQWRGERLNRKKRGFSVF